MESEFLFQLTSLTLIPQKQIIWNAQINLPNSCVTKWPHSTKQKMFSLIQYVPVLCYLLSNLATSSFDHRQLSQQIEMYTGGISFSTYLYRSPTNSSDTKAYLHIGTTSFAKNFERTLELLREIMFSTKFDNFDLLKVLLHAVCESSDIFWILFMIFYIFIFRCYSLKKKKLFYFLEYLFYFFRISFLFCCNNNFASSYKKKK